MFSRNPFRGQARSLADAPPPPIQTTTPRAKSDPGVAAVRFEVRIKDKMERRDAKFNTSQPLSDLYDYLEREVFESVTDLQITQAFPRAVIPRDAERNLASMSIRGQVLLQVGFKDAQLRKQT
jgi:hypothetical protein